MKIVIDARLYNQTGVGRYIANLISNLRKIDQRNQYVLLVRAEDKSQIKLLNNRWRLREVNLPWHSFAEQLVMPFILLSEKPDLVHIPYFNIPIFYPGKFVVTIHDLIINHFDTGKATTGPYLFYKLRRLAYQMILAVGLARANRVLTVSETTKQELIDHYYLAAEKIVVTLEGVTDNFIYKPDSGLRWNDGKTSKFFLYVGNAYPHKNLSILIQALKKLDVDYRLKLVGKMDYFYERLAGEVRALSLTNRVEFVGLVSDKELQKLYQNALGLVIPSLMEGFGLPVLEATAAGCPVIASDIRVFHELFADLVTYFDPHSPTQLAEKLNWLAKNCDKERLRVQDLALPILSKFSWDKLARTTLNVYENSSSL